MKIKVIVEPLFSREPRLNPIVVKLTGVVRDFLVEEIVRPVIWKVCHLDKLLDELAGDIAVDKILCNQY